MTRKSKREIETALDALAAAGRDVDAEGVRTWVEAYIKYSLQNGWDMEFGGSSPSSGAPGSDEVCIKKTTGDAGVEFFAPEEDVPEWIDRDKLPVKG